jgi:hypothetical protein
MNSPIKIRNLTLTGNWQQLSIQDDMIAVSIQARGDNALQVAQVGRTAEYYTVKAGTVLNLSSGNFSSDAIMVKGTAADAVELLGFVRS